MCYLLDVDGREGGNNREPNSSNSGNISGPFTLSLVISPRRIRLMGKPIRKCVPYHSQLLGLD